MFAEDELEAFFWTNFGMKSLDEFNWSIDEIESLPAWERKTYVIMINEYIKERIRNKQANQG